MAPRSRPLLRCTASAGALALLGGSLLSVAGSVVAPTAAGATETYRESLAVWPDSGVVSTEATLLADTPYTLEVTGSYEVEGRRADAECSTASLAPVWRRDRPEMDLLVAGQDVDWQAVEPDLLGCDTEHRYHLDVVLGTAQPLTFALDIPAAASGVGHLKVVLEGPAVKGSSDTDAQQAPEVDDAPTEAPSSGETGEEAPADASAPSDPPPGDDRPAPAPAPAPAPSPQPASAPSAPAPASPERRSQSAVALPRTDEPTRSADAAGGRVLATGELVELLAPNASDHAAGAPAEGARSIELALEPDHRVATLPGREFWIVLVGLLAVLQFALFERPRQALVRLAMQEARTAGELLTGGSRRKALAHRDEAGDRRLRAVTEALAPRDSGDPRR